MVSHLFPDFLRTVLSFLVVLGVLVFVHELGHYLAARWCGVYVEAFSIGFGRKIAGWTDRRGTQWQVSWIPLGGYVRLHGQERPENVADDVRATWRHGWTFHEKSVGARALIVAAGPIANFLLAFVLFAGLVATAGQPMALPVIGEVLPNTPAARSGLHTADRVIQIDGEDIRRFEDIQRIVAAHPAVAVDMLLQRGDSRLNIMVTPDPRDDGHGGKMGVLGVRAASSEFVRLSPPRAVAAALRQTGEVTRETLAGVWQMLSGQRGTEDLGGPLRIAQLSGQVALLGIPSLITLIAVLSINLGLINLFPIPVLDGGHLVFYALEALRGRPIPTRAQEYGFRAGFALLIGLFIFATWNDLTHFGLFRWVAGLIG
jgi:regulator of sigma E protease